VVSWSLFKFTFLNFLCQEAYHFFYATPSSVGCFALASGLLVLLFDSEVVGFLWNVDVFPPVYPSYSCVTVTALWIPDQTQLSSVLTYTSILSQFHAFRAWNGSLRTKRTLDWSVWGPLSCSVTAGDSSLLLPPLYEFLVRTCPGIRCQFSWRTQIWRSLSKAVDTMAATAFKKSDAAAHPRLVLTVINNVSTDITSLWSWLSDVN
jgi:hypothetical protein